MRTALILLLLLTAGTSVLANPRRADRDSGQAMASATSNINCGTVRSYVTLVGLVQAAPVAEFIRPEPVRTISGPSDLTTIIDDEPVTGARGRLQA
jgi:hypothetical protein